MSIYLDHNATTPIAAEAAEAMAECYRSGFANPASLHHAGRRARRAIEGMRERMGELLGASDVAKDRDEVIFTSGGTEANNLALLGMAGDGPGHLVVSAIEHPSVAAAADELARRGWRVDRLAANRDGTVRVEQLEELLTSETRLASVMLANHETGVVQPIARAAAICRAKGVPLHVDAVQAVGKMEVDFRALGADLMSMSAHKLHGPAGVGALVVRHGISLAPMLFGGFQQESVRPGTEAIALAAGMLAALELARREGEARLRRMGELRDSLERQLKGGWPGLIVNGAAGPRLPHATNVAFAGLDRQAMLMALDLAGIACSTGSACASGSPEPSAVLTAMGCEETVLEGSFRLAVGATTTGEEIDEAAARILKIANDLQSGVRLDDFAAEARQRDRKAV
jgi:cysteine desulfurase